MSPDFAASKTNWVSQNIFIIIIIIIIIIVVVLYDLQVKSVSLLCQICCKIIWKRFRFHTLLHSFGHILYHIIYGCKFCALQIL
jgi:hypothetical protein